MLQRSILLALILLALSACSRHGELFDDPGQQQLWAEQKLAASEITQWNLYARGALRLKGEAYNIGVRWRREGDHRFTMLLDAPFGQGVLRIDGTGPGHFQLKLPDGRQLESNSAEALLDEVVGWSLPLSGFDFWVRGLPDPRTPSSHRLDSLGRAQSIQQDGWEISYLDYFDDSSQPALPRRLSLANDKLTLKLAIERWQQAPAETNDSDLFPSFN